MGVFFATFVTVDLLGVGGCVLFQEYADMDEPQDACGYDGLPSHGCLLARPGR